MTTSYNRRAFFKTSGFVAGGGALAYIAQAVGVAGTLETAAEATLPLSQADRTVLTFAGQYASGMRFIGAGVLAKKRGLVPRALNILAEVADPGAMQAALTARTLFPGAYGQDNAIFFTLDGVNYTLENLLPATFGERLTGLGARKELAFAHDALSYDPSTSQLSDPFHAVKDGALKLVNKTFGGAEALDTVLRGTSEAHDLGLKEGADFTAWSGRILRAITRVPASAATAATYLSQVASLADKLTTAKMETLLHARAVETALRQVFGIDVAAVIAQFKSQRAQLDGSVSNATLWLAILLGPEVQTNSTNGAATNWVKAGTRFQVIRSRAALAQAATLLANTPA